MYDVRAAKRLFGEFCEFLEDRYHIAIDSARDVPHFRDFLDHLVERASLYRVDGISVQKPIRRTLSTRIAQLQRFLREMRCSFQINTTMRTYATELQSRYVDTTSGALAARPDEIKKMVTLLDTGRPRHLRLRAITLLVGHAWARPSEIINRRYPDDVNPDHRDGVVIIVPTAKTNDGPRPESFLIRHDEDMILCAVCALREWLEWLGPRYYGPLFPALTANNTVKTNSYSVDQYSLALSKAFVAAGITQRKYSSYSLRKAQATAAAARHMPLKGLQKHLRHKSFDESITYVERDVLFGLMKKTLE